LEAEPAAGTLLLMPSVVVAEARQAPEEGKPEILSPHMLKTGRARVAAEEPRRARGRHHHPRRLPSLSASPPHSSITVVPLLCRSAVGRRALRRETALVVARRGGGRGTPRRQWRRRGFEGREGAEERGKGAAPSGRARGEGARRRRERRSARAPHHTFPRQLGFGGGRRPWLGKKRSREQGRRLVEKGGEEKKTKERRVVGDGGTEYMIVGIEWVI
jgi:hypothetical protein